MAPAAPSGKGWKSMRNGAMLQCAEAITLGMPLEVWKTHMGRFRHLSTLDSLATIYKQVCAPCGGVPSHARTLIALGGASARPAPSLARRTASAAFGRARHPR